MVIDRRVWVYAIVFAILYGIMKFVVPWHVLMP